MSSTPDLSTLEQMPSMGSADIKKKVERDLASAKDTAKTPDEKLDGRKRTIHTFEFLYKDDNGKVWKGQFKNTRLTIRHQQVVGLIEAQMSANRPYDSLDVMTRNINATLAHMAVSLDPEVRPDWAKDLESLDDTDLLFALYREVASHEAIFHGRPAPEAPSKGGDQ